MGPSMVRIALGATLWTTLLIRATSRVIDRTPAKLPCRTVGRKWKRRCFKRFGVAKTKKPDGCRTSEQNNETRVLVTFDTRVTGIDRLH